MIILVKTDNGRYTVDCDKIIPEDELVFARTQGGGSRFPVNLRTSEVGGNMEKDNELLTKAIEYANKMHAGDCRKGTSMPYIVHPLEVMHNLYLMRADKSLMAAGVLHDVVEDTDATMADIENRFGARIAELVKSHTEQHKEWPWEQRKITAMEDERTLSKEKQMLALADKLSNIRAMHRDFIVLGDMLWERFNRGKDKQSWYYHSSANVLKALANEPEVAPYYDEFKKLVDEVFGPEPDGCLK